MKLELQLAQKQEKEAPTNRYIIVTNAPIEGNKEVNLYLAPADLSDVIAYSKAPTLDGSVVELFDQAIKNRLDGGESTRPDFLGWPAFFMSGGFIEADGDNFFGYEPFITYPIPPEALLQFARLYTKRVEKAMRREQHQQGTIAIKP